MMSLQWVAVAFFLYAEIGLTLLLIIPLLSSRTWKKVFSFQLFAAIQPVWNIAFYAIVLILVVLFADSIRMMRKYSVELPQGSTLDAKIDQHLKECRGQRNFYITGFALFLILVIRRLISMLSGHATLQAKHDAVLKQAQSANAELERRMAQEERRDSVEDVGRAKEEAATVEAKPEEGERGPTKEEFEAVQTELEKARINLEALKKQAEATNTEYDRLAAEHQILQNEQHAAAVGGEEESKKDQ